MEIIAKVSKGSRMDQIYLPKNRYGLPVGNYVVVQPLETKRISKEKLYFYNVRSIEPIKLQLINEIINIINKKIKKYENIIITGSFINEGFNFNDIDILLITEGKVNIKYMERNIEEKTKIKPHIILISNKELVEGLSTDPLYQIMLSNCIAKNRFVYRVKYKINYKILDLHLLKSKTLIDNFDDLNGNEKYSLVRNMVAISLYLDIKDKINQEKVDKEIKNQFNLKDINEIRQNILQKDKFLKKYKEIYNKTFNKIIKGVKNASKQK